MSFDDFNMVTAKKPYAYRRNPLYGHAYVILRRGAAGGYEPAGGYTVLDGGEDETLSERKVMNLVALMNDEEGRLIDLCRSIALPLGDGRTTETAMDDALAQAGVVVTSVASFGAAQAAQKPVPRGMQP